MSPTVWLIGILIGVQLIGEGAALGYLAWGLRRGRPAAGRLRLDHLSLCR